MGREDRAPRSPGPVLAGLLLLASACGSDSAPRAPDAGTAPAPAAAPAPPPAAPAGRAPPAGSGVSTAHPALTAPGQGAATAWFLEVAEERGLVHRHRSGGRGEYHLPEIMGGGAALFDADGDGDLDVYLVQGGDHALSPSGETPGNALFLQGPDGRFSDASEGSGADDRSYGMGVAVGDFDGDGLPDLYLANFGPDRLLRNLGGGRFEDVTDSAGGMAGGLAGGWSASAAFADFDRDGDLDIFVTRYVAYDPDRDCRDRAGRSGYCAPDTYAPVHDVLLRNEGGGVFSDQSEAAGLTTAPAPGLGLACADFDGDGWIDVYVANDGDMNQLWINQGDGSFRDEALVAGAALNLQGRTEAGMGVIAADLDGDLDLDFFVTNLRAESNTLLRRDGGTAGYRDVTPAVGLAVSSMIHTGFGVEALDLELDGDLDLAIANGAVDAGPPFPGADLPEPWIHYAEPNLIYENLGEGRFEPSEEGRSSFGLRVEISRALAVGDVDRDGRLDLLVVNVEGPVRLHLNRVPRRGHWISVRPLDAERRLAPCSQVVVSAGGRRFLRTVGGGSSYLTASEQRAHFGLGTARRYDSVELRWPDGGVEIFEGGEADRAIDLVRGTGRTGS